MRQWSFAWLWRPVAAALVAFGCQDTMAFQVDTGSEDVQLRWDNTLKYNYGSRVQGVDKSITGNSNFDIGDRRFSSGTVTNRLDLLSELDLRYKRNWGFRASGAGWYDAAYDEHRKALSGYAERYYSGPSGELLDAFVFGGVDLFGRSLSFRAGKHTLFWGEGLVTGGMIHGVAYGQMPLDLAKGFAVPGTEAKELFLPLTSASLKYQVTDSLSFAAQYYLDWKPARVPESGTYLGAANFYLQGSANALATGGPGEKLEHGKDSEPNGRKNLGANLRWSPEFLEGGAIGFYYRRFADILPQLHAQPGVFKDPGTGCAALGLIEAEPGRCYDPKVIGPADLAKGTVGKYLFAYGEDIDLYGVSVSKQILGASVAAEADFRRNMPLVSGATSILPAAFAAAVPGSLSAAPTDGQTSGARGDTFHALVNVLALMGKTSFLWDSATFISELSYSRWLKVTQNETVFAGRDGYNAIDRVTRDSFNLDVVFTPTWLQLVPGVDVSMPMAYSRGISGNSAVQNGGSEGAGNYSVGLGAAFYGKYFVDVAYAGYFGDTAKDASGVVATPNGLPALLEDRGWVSATLKSTF